jgi:hypothetical protein
MRIKIEIFMRRIPDSSTAGSSFGFIHTYSIVVPDHETLLHRLVADIDIPKTVG